MKNIIDKIRKEVSEINDKYVKDIEPFDFFKEHVNFVVENAIALAKKYNADLEIVELGALLHDIALIKRIGTKVDHHINGANIAVEMLEKYNYPKDKIERVKKVVYNHRSSKNSENIEEQCVADADTLAHFSNIPMMFECAFGLSKLSLEDGREYVKRNMQKDFNDLSRETKKEFSPKYRKIMNVLFPN